MPEGCQGSFHNLNAPTSFGSEQLTHKRNADYRPGLRKPVLFNFAPVSYTEERLFFHAENGRFCLLSEFIRSDTYGAKNEISVRWCEPGGVIF